jgi:hypothetical protein
MHCLKTPLVRALFAAAIGVASTAASAADPLTCGAGNTTALGTYSSDGAFNIGNLYATVPSSGVVDCYSFSTSFDFSLNGYYSYFQNLDSGGIGVVGAPGNLNTSFLNHSQVGQFGQTDPGLASSIFTAGSYTLAVTLNGQTPPANGPYLYMGKAFITEASAVPEPHTYALVLAGLGVLGFMGKRRRLN